MPENDETMKFIYLKYGDGKEILLNPDCASCNFMIYLRERLAESGCNFGTDESALDLCDTNGTVQGIQKLLPMEQVGQLVTHKEIYVPIIVNTSTSDEDEVTSFTPILSPEDQLYDKILKILSKQQRKTTKKKQDNAPPPTPQTNTKPNTKEEKAADKKQKKSSLMAEGGKNSRQKSSKLGKKS